jgi:hypothetical protein
LVAQLPVSPRDLLGLFLANVPIAADSHDGSRRGERVGRIVHGRMR